MLTHIGIQMEDDYFSTRSTRKKMKTVGNLHVKNNGDG